MDQQIELMINERSPILTNYFSYYADHPRRLGNFITYNDVDCAIFAKYTRMDLPRVLVNPPAGVGMDEAIVYTSCTLRPYTPFLEPLTSVLNIVPRVENMYCLYLAPPLDIGRTVFDVHPDYSATDQFRLLLQLLFASDTYVTEAVYEFLQKEILCYNKNHIFYLKFDPTISDIYTKASTHKQLLRLPAQHELGRI